MNRFLLEVILAVVFALIALGGLIMLIYGIKMRPAKKGEGAEAGEEILLEFSGRSDNDPGLFDLETAGERLGREEKKTFDPGKHRPEELGSLKKD